MDHIEEMPNRFDRGEVRHMTRNMPIARRILMFPLTRILIAAALFMALQISIGIGSAKLPAAWQGPILTQVLSLGIALFVFAFITRIVERRTLAEDGLPLEGALRGTAAGFALGAAMIGIVIGVLAVAAWYDVTRVAGAWSALASGLFLFLLVAVAEEVLFRGVLFRVVEEGMGTWAALVIITALFGGAHLINDNATLLGALGTGLAGAALGAAYVLTRNLWLAIGIHWSLNFVQGTVFGMPVSGRDAGASLVESNIRGPELWTGGAFGIEAGLVTFLVSALVSAGLLVLAARRGRVITPAWMARGRRQATTLD